MRKTALSIALSLTCVGLASAWGPSAQEAPEARAFAALSFGDSAARSSSQFFYGMRLDQSEQSRREGRPALAAVQFDRQGFNDARLNGVPFAYTVRLAQNDEGGDGSEPGTFSNFTVVDWTLLALGAAAIGYGIAEVVDQEDTPDPQGGGTTTGGATTGGTTGGTTGTPLGGLLGGLLGGGTTTGGTTTGGTTTGGTPLGGLLGGLLGGTYRAPAEVLGETRASREYQEWLDGGSGQMGDLTAQ